VLRMTAVGLLVACASNKPALDLGPVPSGVSLDARIQYYDVSAATLTELRAAMRRQGPKWEGRTWQAVTTSDLHWTFQIRRLSASCEIRDARVQMRTVVVFPRWTPSAEPDSSMTEWWRQLNAGLVEHEKGHALISLRTAGEIVHDLGTVMHSCGDIGAFANARAQRLLQESRTKQAEYDVTTRHGALQIQQAGRLQEP